MENIIGHFEAWKRTKRIHETVGRDWAAVVSIAQRHHIPSTQYQAFIGAA
jgi:hypothetical protein